MQMYMRILEVSNLFFNENLQINQNCSI